MISILIPIYNFNCSALIETLHAQASTTSHPFEIIALDDGSTEPFLSQNKSISGLHNVHYEVLKDNVGRSAVRNLLARKAKYDALLFIDCDSAIERGDFFKKYIQHIKQAPVIYGGRVYQKNKPDTRFQFHWKYGLERESRDCNARRKHPYLWFHSNNFLIHKSTVSNLKFDDNLTTYGYEDSLFSAALEKNKISILHIDNPVIHQGLIDNETFLLKTDLALKNLHVLLRQGHIVPVRLANAYRWVNRLGLSYMLYQFHKLREKSYRKQIKEGRIALRSFDLYRLGVLISLDRN